MSTTAQVLIDGTQARAMDSSKTQWSDAELLVYVNEAIDYIHKQLISNKSELALKYASSPISTVLGTETYTLPTDFWAVYEGDDRDKSGIHLIDGTEHAWLKQCAPGDSVELTGADESTPTQFYINDKLGLLPVPDGVYSIYMKYYFTSPTLALGTSMPWNDIFNTPIKSFVSSRAFARRGMQAAGEMAIYNELESQAMRIIIKRDGRKVRVNPRVY